MSLSGISPLSVSKDDNEDSTLFWCCVRRCHNCDLQASDAYWKEGERGIQGRWVMYNREVWNEQLGLRGRQKTSSCNDLLLGCGRLLGACSERSRPRRRWNGSTAIPDPIRGSRSLAGIIGLLWSCGSGKWTSEKWQRKHRNFHRTCCAIQGGNLGDGENS